MGRFTGTDADGAKFDASLGFLFNPEEMEKFRVWRLAFLGRYCHQQAVFLQDTPVSEIRAMIDATIELMKKESALQNQHETRT